MESILKMFNTDNRFVLPYPNCQIVENYYTEFIVFRRFSIFHPLFNLIFYGFDILMFQRIWRKLVALHRAKTEEVLHL